MLEKKLKRIHVLRLRDSYRVGGPEKTILGTASNINCERFKFTLASFEEANSKNEFIEAAKELNVSILTIWNEYFFDPRTVRYMANYLQLNEVDIFHGHDYKSRYLGYLAARKTGVHKIATVHGWIQNTKKDIMYTLVDKMLLKKYEKIIVVSWDLKKKLQNIGIKEEKIILLHNAVEIKSKYINRNGSLRRELGIEGSDIIVATVGRLSKEKGMEDFIEAAAIALKKNRNITYLIIGEGPEERVLQKIVNNNGLGNRIKFLGYRNDMESIYPEIDILVLASYTEGLPKVIIEGLAYERPVIATSVGGVPEVIIDNETGILIQPRAPEMLAKEIELLIYNENRRKHLGRNGKILIEKDFNLKTRTEKLEEIYENIRR